MKLAKHWNPAESKPPKKSGRYLSLGMDGNGGFYQSVTHYNLPNKGPNISGFFKPEPLAWMELPAILEKDDEKDSG